MNTFNKVLYIIAKIVYLKSKKVKYGIIKNEKEGDKDEKTTYNFMEFIEI